MESNSKNTEVTSQPTGSTRNTSSGRVWGGLFIVLIGVLALARQAGADIPRWLFSIESILIAVGIYIGIRHSFRGFAWGIPIAIGGVLFLDDLYPHFDIHDFTWPLLIIGFGLFIILRGSKRGRGSSATTRPTAFTEESSEDVLDSTVIFGGAKKNIISKNFLGGEAVTVFGGTELNLMQAELTRPVVLELTQVFGGTKLIVPAHWKVQTNEMVAILGGIDDKRPILGNTESNSNQVLILKGTCMLGGIEVRSY